MKRKFQVGDKLKIKLGDEVVEGIIIDFDDYGKDIVFKIAFSRGEIDIGEEQLKKLKKEARCSGKES